MDRSGKLERDEVVAALVLGVIGAVVIGVQGYMASRMQRFGSEQDPWLGLKARFARVRDRISPPEVEVEVTDAMLSQVHDEARRITRGEE